MVKSIQRKIKDILDFIGALTGIIVLFVPFIAIATAIKLNSKGPVFFKAERSGKDNKKFNLYKFRSMVDGAVNIGLGIEVEKNDSRITSVGNFLRTWSLDELPQLINVLKGEMSLAGPRPALPHQVEKYSEFEKKRLMVKPGLTGWSQVNGRNTLPWKERIKQDIWYIENWSLWLDLKIILKTPKVLLTKEGIYGEGGMVKDYE